METSVKTGDVKIERHRITIGNYGSLLGGQVFTVEAKNIDPEYNKKKQSTDILVPHLPIRIYVLRRITVGEVKVESDGDNNVVVIFNNDPSLRFPVTTSGLSVPTVATIREAIQAYERKESPIFFKDCVKATAEIAALNKASYDKAIRLSRELASQATGLQEAMELDREMCEKYLNEMNTDISITLETTE